MRLIRIIGISLLIPVSVLSVFVILEVFLRIKGQKWEYIPFSFIISSKIYKLDSELIYRQRPNIRHPKADLYTDKTGLRTVKPDSINYDGNTGSVVILGDSSVWGNTLYADSYPNQLQEMLSEENKNYNVINAGIPGYGTDQEFFFFNKYILSNIRPSILIWNINYNDIFDNIDRPIYDLREDKLVRIPVWKNGIYLTAVISDFLPDAVRKNSRSVNHILFNLSKIRFHYDPERTNSRWSVNKIRREIDEMQKLSREYDFKFIVAFSPSKSIVDNLPMKNETIEGIEQIENSIPGIEIIDQNKYLLQANETWRKNQTENVLGMSSNTELFINETGQFPIESWHPNILGNYLMAKSIAEKISDNK